MSRVLRTALVLGCAAALVLTALLPGSRAEATAPAALPGVTPSGMPFLPSSTPMNVTISSLFAQNLSVQQGVTFTMANGQTSPKVNKYTFTKLSVTGMAMSQQVNGYTVKLAVPGDGSLGGYDTAGNAETTVMWGNISNLCVVVLFKICGIQGLLDFFGSIIPLTAGATDFTGTIYAIQTKDDHAAVSSTNNPVHLPGSLAVTTP